jgi:hypothetical protein
MIGSLLITFDEVEKGRDNAYFWVTVNGEARNTHYTDSNRLYTTDLFVGDVCTICISGQTQYSEHIGVIRRDYTTDDQGGDKGILDNPITEQDGGPGLCVTFTATTVSNAYNFEYRIDCGTRRTVWCYDTYYYECLSGNCSTNSFTQKIQNSFQLEEGKFYNDISGTTGYVIGINEFTEDCTGATLVDLNPFDSSSDCSFFCPPFDNEGQFLILNVERKQYEYNFPYDTLLSTLNVTRRSNDFGQSYTNQTGFTFGTISGQTDFSDASVSYDGKYQLLADTFTYGYGFGEDLGNALGGYINISNTTGNTFTPYTGTSRSVAWKGTDISQNGKYIAVAQQYGPMYYSLDSGNTFSFVSNSNKDWVDVAIPDNAPLPIYGLATDGIYKLTTLAGPFTKLTGLTQTVGSGGFGDFGISQDRKYMIAAEQFYGQVWVSSNSGNTFNQTSFDSNLYDYYKCALSATGQYMYYGARNGRQLYRSNDYGVTWTTPPGPLPIESSLFDISVSASGRIVYILYTEYPDTYRCKVYRSTDYGLTYTLMVNSDWVYESGNFIDRTTYNNFIVEQNKKYYGIEPYYPAPPTPPVTPTYGPNILKVEYIFNWTGASANNIEVDYLGSTFTDIDLLEIDSNWIDSIQPQILSTTNGSFSGFTYINNPDIVGTFSKQLTSQIL